jgi:hypothetical protein
MSSTISSALIVSVCRARLTSVMRSTLGSHLAPSNVTR